MHDFDTLWNYNQPEDTAQKFQTLLSKAVPGTEYHLELLTQIARTHSLRRNFAKAHEVLDQVELQLTEKTPVAHTRYLLERGRTHNSEGDRETSQTQFLLAWDLATEIQADFYAVDAAHMLAIASPTPQKQHDWNLKAINHAEQSSDTRARGWLGSLLNNTGWTYFDEGHYPAALEMFQKALKFREQQGEPEPIRIAKWCIARVYRATHRIDEAYEIQKSLEAEYDMLKDTEPGYTYEEIGELLLIKGERENSKSYFSKAYTTLSKDRWLVANEPERLERLKTLSEN